MYSLVVGIYCFSGQAGEMSVVNRLSFVYVVKL